MEQEYERLLHLTRRQVNAAELLRQVQAAQEGLEAGEVQRVEDFDSYSV